MAPILGLLHHGVDALQSCQRVLEAFGRAPESPLVPPLLQAAIAEVAAAATAAVTGSSVAAELPNAGGGVAGDGGSAADWFAPAGDDSEVESHASDRDRDSDDAGASDASSEGWEDVGVEEAGPGSDAHAVGGMAAHHAAGGAGDADAAFLAAIADPLLTITRSTLPRLQRLEAAARTTASSSAPKAALPFPLTQTDVDQLLPAITRVCASLLGAIRSALHAHLPPLAAVLEAEGGGATAAAKRRRGDAAGGGGGGAIEGGGVDPLVAASAAAATRGLDTMLAAALARQNAANRALYGAAWDAVGGGGAGK